MTAGPSMSEAGSTPVSEGPSAGTLLRRAREAAGLHVATLAVALKVPVRKLEALESDRHDLLPDAVFARALAASVCRHLKIDPQPVMERLPQSATPRLTTEKGGLNTPFRAPGDARRPGWVEPLTRPVSLAVMALLVGALVIVFLPVSRQAEPQATATTEPVMPPDAPASTAAAPAESGVMPVSVGASVASVSTGAPAAVQPASAPVASAAPLPTGMASAPLQVPVSTTGIVVFSARAPSWVQVTDAKGTAVLRRLLESGETAGASGALPLSVIVGSAGATDVQVRGKPFNLAPIARDNVARFEVK